MFPSFSITNTVNGVPSNIEHFRKLERSDCFGFQCLSDEENIFVAKFRFSARFSFWNFLWMEPSSVSISASYPFWMKSRPMIFSSWFSSLFNFVLFAINRSSDKQVVRSYAQRIVTMMANPKPKRNFSKMNHPRNYVSSKILPCWIKPKSSVPSRCAASPDPAVANLWNVRWDWSVLVHLAPKSFNILWGHKQKHHRPAKVLSAHVEPQPPDDGENVLSSHALLGYNKAVENLTMPLEMAI